MKVVESSASQEEAVKPADIGEEEALKAARRGANIEPRWTGIGVIDRLGLGDAGAEFDQNDEGRGSHYGNGCMQRHAKGAVVLVGVREVNVGHLDGGQQCEQEQTDEHHPSRRRERTGGARRCLEELQNATSITSIHNNGQVLDAGGVREDAKKWAEMQGRCVPLGVARRLNCGR
jgi:hypothetical protein